MTRFRQRTQLSGQNFLVEGSIQKKILRMREGGMIIGSSGLSRVPAGVKEDDHNSSLEYFQKISNDE